MLRSSSGPGREAGGVARLLHKPRLAGRASCLQHACQRRRLPQRAHLVLAPFQLRFAPSHQPTQIDYKCPRPNPCEAHALPMHHLAHPHLPPHNADEADALSTALAQQAAVSSAASPSYFYNDCLTLRRVALPNATPLPHELARMTASITHRCVYIANVHDFSRWRLRSMLGQARRPLPSLRLASCADLPAAARVRVCSSSMAASLAFCLASPMHCDHDNRTRSRWAEAIIARVYAAYCSRGQVRAAAPRHSRSS